MASQVLYFTNDIGQEIHVIEYESKHVTNFLF